jgi:deazaflavin-dependent oxidoreductase (nitroreductase family)
MHMAIINPPKGINRLFWRFPIVFFQLRMDWVFGGKILLLRHNGRKSGKERTAALEVVRVEAENNRYYVCSGFGKRANWYQNLVANPAVEIRVGGKNKPVKATFLSPDDCGDEMVRYVKNHPKLAKGLMKMIGYKRPQSLEEYHTLASQQLPFVMFEVVAD